MKNKILILTLIGLLISCDDFKEVSSIDPENWKGRAAEPSLRDSLQAGMTYLSVYSQIYSMTEHRLCDLSATISMRNVNRADTVFILAAEYYNTKGDLIRSYLPNPIYLAPLETVEIVIDEKDKEGGTGANFIFEWNVAQHTSEPLFEAVMISTSGSQGLSFTTQGKTIKLTNH